MSSEVRFGFRTWPLWLDLSAVRHPHIIDATNPAIGRWASYGSNFALNIDGVEDFSIPLELTTDGLSWCSYDDEDTKSCLPLTRD